MLLIVSCVLASAAVFQSFRFDQADQFNRTRVAGVEHETGLLLVTLNEMRAAQMAYLATGQGPDFWMRRATDLAGNVEAGLTRLQSTFTDPAARTQLGRASTALADLVQLDGRARSAIDTDQRFLASDIVFADGVTPTQQVADALRSARDAERSSLDATFQRDRMMRLALMPASLVMVLLAAWLAGSNRSRGPARSKAEELAQMLRELPPPVKAPGVAASTAPPVATPPARASASPESGRSVINLPEMAELCVDLARVMDERDMPALLQRAARTLDATGIVVWVVDVAGATLTPALAHGYSERVLARLGTLDVSADNVTSAAFRSVRPQTIPGAGSNGQSSAIAVPLVTTAGCNGVLAAEIPGAVPPPESIAAARIMAAQLAAMLSPVEPSAQQVAEA